MSTIISKRRKGNPVLKAQMVFIVLGIVAIIVIAQVRGVTIENVRQWVNGEVSQDFTQDHKRIAKLEAEVKELKARLAK